MALRAFVLCGWLVGTPTHAQVLHNVSFLGGSGFDHARDVAVDAQGFIYIVGGTENPYWPTTHTISTAGTPEAAAVLQMDIFVAKLDPTATTVVWSTRVGGPNYERAYAVEVDSAGFVYVAGRAGAGAPITASSFQPTFQGGFGSAFYGNQDGYVFKLQPDGSALVWASYFGTADTLSSTIIRDIAVDAAGNVYLAASVAAGWAYPPAVSAAFLNSPLGSDDNVLAKVSSAGNALLWARYVGGSNLEEGVPSVRLNSKGDVVLLTTSRSSDAPTSPTAYQRTLAGQVDFYVALFSPTGTPGASTFLGGSSDELLETHQLAIGRDDSITIAAGSLSSDYPTTPGAYDRSHNGNGGPQSGGNTNYSGDVVVSTLSADLTTLLASTFVGGQGGESAEGVALDSHGNVLLTGGTFSSDFPVSAQAQQSSRQGQIDSFFVALSADLQHLVYASFLGGMGNEVGRSACVDAKDNFFLVGESGGTGADTLPVMNAFQSSYGGATDALFARFGPVSDAVAPGAPTNLQAQ